MKTSILIACIVFLTSCAVYPTPYGGAVVAPLPYYNGWNDYNRNYPWRPYRGYYGYPRYYHY